MNEVEFTHAAIKKLRKGNYKGIHTVYSNFNSAFKEYFGTDPIEAVKGMVENGDIESRFARGGVMIYLPGDMETSNTVQTTIDAITGGKKASKPKRKVNKKNTVKKKKKK